ncbi:class I SAM-dependent methyltransferase [Nocardioides iriomotensis]|uniref:Class I SAM-dependent methyltransferase n=1 Tax=Nocardioides iriomotensis TaxID=715784 RepID=A0A4Q5IZH6_9ACTN|nr:class I SAM-dependent methyltransferase [Nocardioides iriomotensis]RYU11630.1 class I SAM-dependent methyltransferase [Nocardioides iriomotensis]
MQDQPGAVDGGLAAGNEEQYAAWNGDEGRHWAAHPEFYDRSIRRLHRPLMEAADIGARDRVLDIGCGNGECAREAARCASRGTALGIDLSLPMIRVAEAAAEREGLTNASFVQGDAQVHPFRSAAFDVAISRTGAMFFADQVAAFRNIARALRPGGRLAMVSWRTARENEWIASLFGALTPDAPLPAPPADAPTPFRHADPANTTRILTVAGFDEVALQPLDTPMYFGRDADEGFPILRDLLGWTVRDLEPTDAEKAMTRLSDLLVQHETPDGVAFGCAAWLITARRAPTT